MCVSICLYRLKVVTNDAERSKTHRLLTPNENDNSNTYQKNLFYYFLIVRHINLVHPEYNVLFFYYFYFYISKVITYHIRIQRLPFIYKLILVNSDLSRAIKRLFKFCHYNLNFRFKIIITNNDDNNK